MSCRDDPLSVLLPVNACSYMSECVRTNGARLIYEVGKCVRTSSPRLSCRGTEWKISRKKLSTVARSSSNFRNVLQAASLRSAARACDAGDTLRG